MNFRDLIDAAGVRRRARKGFPELTEVQAVALSLADLHNLQMIRKAAGLSLTDSELIRSILRCAAFDLLGAYDGSVSVIPPVASGGARVIIQQKPTDNSQKRASVASAVSVKPPRQQAE